MRRFGTHIHGGMMVMIEIECTCVIDNGVLCDGIEVHGLVKILYNIFERVLETLACGALGLEPTHLVSC